MDEQGASIRDRLTLLRRIAPKKSGLLLYRLKEEKTRPTKACTLFVYIKSTDNTYALHETFFKKKHPLTPQQWERFMETYVLKGHAEEGDPRDTMGLLRGVILPAVNLRSQKFWDVRAVIGFVTHDIHQSSHPKVSKKRHKAKSQKRTDGQTDIRRRHRNRKRKTK